MCEGFLGYDQDDKTDVHVKQAVELTGPFRDRKERTFAVLRCGSVAALWLRFPSLGPGARLLSLSGAPSNITSGSSWKQLATVLSVETQQLFEATDRYSLIAACPLDSPQCTPAAQ